MTRLKKLRTIKARLSPSATLFQPRVAGGFHLLYYFVTLCMYMRKKELSDVVDIIFSYYRQNGRSFPWRETNNPYHILVSEYMLQQTQTDRVVPKYYMFLKKFPTVQKLAGADRRDVLALWSGLGYNRRAIALHNAAKIVVDTHNGLIPKEKEILLTLPGIGEYTAGAVMIFAYDMDAVVVETNIRTVVFHHCIPEDQDVDDTVVKQFVEPMMRDAGRKRTGPRVFYSALMDYGSYLKQSGVAMNTRSKQYTKQKKFAGSVRQARGELLRLCLEHTNGLSSKNLSGVQSEKVTEALAGLVSDGIVEKRNNRYYLIE